MIGTTKTTHLDHWPLLVARKNHSPFRCSDSLPQKNSSHLNMKPLMLDDRNSQLRCCQAATGGFPLADCHLQPGEKDKENYRGTPHHPGVEKTGTLSWTGRKMSKSQGDQVSNLDIARYHLHIRKHQVDLLDNTSAFMKGVLLKFEAPVLNCLMSLMLQKYQ